MRPPPIEIDGAVFQPSTWDEWFRAWMQTWPPWLVQLFALPTWGYVLTVLVVIALIPIAIVQAFLLSVKSDLALSSERSAREVRRELSSLRQYSDAQVDRALAREREATERANAAIAELATVRARLVAAVVARSRAETTATECLNERTPAPPAAD